MPMNRYAAKFIMLPIMAAQLNWPFQMLPNGAAMLVTKEIIAKMKHIVTTATMLTFFFSIFVIRF